MATLKNKVIFRAAYTDYNRNVKTVSVGTREDGSQWVQMKNQASINLCISSAYCGFHNKGTAGAKADVRAAAKAATSSVDLANRLSELGFRFQAVK